MCSPALVAIGISTAYQAYTQKQRAKYESDIQKYNARVAENQAQRVRAAGTEEELAHRRKVAQLLSKQRAQLGAAGVELESGTPEQLQTDVVTLGEADALRIRSNVDTRVSALNTQAELAYSQSEMIESAGNMQAAGTLLSGGAAALSTGVADKWFTPNSAANQGASPLIG